LLGDPVFENTKWQVCFGSWLCENAKPLNRDRRSYSSKTVSVAQRASGFKLEIELKNIILRRVSIFEFLHSQGQRRPSGAADLGLFTPQQRTSEDCRSTSEKCQDQKSSQRDGSGS
jgi:hypothetical protein